jgi:hypothetical protein
MTITHNARLTAAHEGPLVVFIIGLRINRFLKIGQWLPVARAMGPMLSELYAKPDSGFMGHQTMLAGLRTLSMVQYWRDFDSLETYARSREQAHWPAWVAFNKAVGTDGTVGIYHETYSVAAQESIYVNMPSFGLGKVSGLVPATGSREAARERMRG